MSEQTIKHELAEYPLPIDADGNILNEGDRVFTHGFTDEGWGAHYGTLHRNTEFPNVSDWFIAYEDGEQCAVLDFNDVFKVVDEA